MALTEPKQEKTLKALQAKLRENGLELREPDNRVLELVKDGQVIARFSRTDIAITNILDATRAGQNFSRN